MYSRWQLEGFLGSGVDSGGKGWALCAYGSVVMTAAFFKVVLRSFMTRCIWSPYTETFLAFGCWSVRETVKYVLLIGPALRSVLVSYLHDRLMMLDVLFTHFIRLATFEAYSSHSSFVNRRIQLPSNFCETTMCSN